jgi:hypothetical protein
MSKNPSSGLILPAERPTSLVTRRNALIGGAGRVGMGEDREEDVAHPAIIGGPGGIAGVDDILRRLVGDEMLDQLAADEAASAFSVIFWFYVGWLLQSTTYADSAGKSPAPTIRL